MMTITTIVTVRRGAEPQWDAVMAERFNAAKGQPGWRGGQLAIPTGRQDQRLIIGSWETRAHWEAWHNEPVFMETRKRLDSLQDGEADIQWHEVVLEATAE